MRNAIPISQTLIKEFETYGYCPRKIYVRYIAKTHEQEPSDSMIKGQYFETMALGSGRGGIKVTDLPRKKNGHVTIDHARIDFQAKRFAEVLDKWGIRMPKANGKQLEIITEVNGILLSGNLDFVSRVNNIYGDFPVAVIDLKLTKDRKNTYGQFCWGEPEKMDKLQASMYPLLFKKKWGHKLPRDYEIMFFYLVFDYKPDFGDNLIPVFYNAAEEEKLMERIRYTNEKMHEAIRTDWPAIPDYEQCKKCPLRISGECKQAPYIEDTIDAGEVFNPFE